MNGQSIGIRPAEARGKADFGWLDSRHSFSFGQYFDPGHMGLGPLRVINEDRVAGGAGFDTHAHADMEILSYVLDGGLEHKDSLGTGSVIRPGDLQRMTAGTGIRHSEFNASKTDKVHFLQIWILPERQGLAPAYEQKHFAPADRSGKLTLLASRDGREGSVTIHQDVDLYSALLGEGDKVNHTIASGRLAWIQVAKGAVTLNGEDLRAGDGYGLVDPGTLTLTGAAPDTDVLVFDMTS